MHSGNKIKLVSLILAIILITSCSKVSESPHKKNFKSSHKSISVNSQRLDINKSEIGVIESSTFNDISYIKFYDSNNENIYTSKINCTDVNSGFLSPVTYKNKVYTNSIGGYSNRSKKVVEFNLKNGNCNTYNVAEGIFSVAANDDYIFTTNSPPKGSILTKYNIKTRRKEKTLKIEGLVQHIALYGSYLYTFSDSDDRDGTITINVIDPNKFNINKIVKIKSDQSVFDSAIYGENIYFTHMMSQDGKTPSSTISAFNIKDNTVKDIKLNEPYSDHLRIYKDKLLISHYDPVNNNGNKLTELNLSTGQQKVYSFKHNLMQLEIKGSKVYICDDKNMYIYNADNFKPLSQFKIMDSRKDYRIDGFFLIY